MSSRQDIFEAIKTHLEGRGIESEKIQMNSDLLGDLDLDSLDTMELTLSMEERFGVEIPDAELENLATIEDAVSLVERKHAVKA